MLTLKMSYENNKDLFSKQHDLSHMYELAESFGICRTSIADIKLDQSSQEYSIKLLKGGIKSFDNLSIFSSIEHKESHYEMSFLEESNSNEVCNPNYLKKYLADLKDFIITENFYDKQIFTSFFKTKYLMKAHASSTEDMGAQDQKDLHNQADKWYNAIQLFHEAICFIHERISEKYGYFRNVFQDFKKSVYQDLGFIIKKIDYLTKENSRNLVMIENLNAQIVDYAHNQKLMESKINLAAQKYVETYACINDFLLALSELKLVDDRELKFINESMLGQLSTNLDTLVQKDNLAALDFLNLKYCDPSNLSHNLSMLSKRLDFFVKSKYQSCYNCMGICFEGSAKQYACGHRLCKKCDINSKDSTCILHAGMNCFYCTNSIKYEFNSNMYKV